MKKALIYGVISLSIFSNAAIACASPVSYNIKSGDTYWKISQRYEVDIANLLETNNAKSNHELNIGQSILIPDGTYNLYLVKSGDTYWKISQNQKVDFNTLLKINNTTSNPQLNVGDIVKIPKSKDSNSSSSYIIHTVKSGDTYWRISNAYEVNLDELISLNNASNNYELNIGDTVKIPSDSGSKQPENPAQPTDKPYITYVNHTIKSGDNFWTLSIQYGIPQYELMQANNMNENSILYDGDVIKVPVHHIPIKSTPGSKYGEYLDWWTQAQYVVPINAVFTVRDFETGVSWTMKRTVGANHADCEPLTKKDAQIMKNVWGGQYSWIARPVIIEYKGRKLAASATSMPHSNYDYISDNGVWGHMDIHFKNSTRHKDGLISQDHQDAITVAAGM